MRADLIAHRRTVSDVVSYISVSVDADDEALSLTFAVHGDSDRIRVPEGRPACTDELWRTTCFELFVRRPDGSYDELNLAPNGSWAAYHFDGYRAGMRPFIVEPPETELVIASNMISFEAQLKIAVPVYSRIGLSAVIETMDGVKSYWALNHPEGAPDFHHDDCFAIAIGPTTLL